MGLRWERVQRVFPDKSIGESTDRELPSGTEPVSVFDYDQLTSQQMMIPDALADALADGSSRRVLSYLANNTEVLANQRVESQGRSVPYSIISGVDWELIARMLSDGRKDPVPMDWVVIHDWMARELDAKVGDRLKIDYFLPETVEGTEVETSFEASIVAIALCENPHKLIVASLQRGSQSLRVYSTTRLGLPWFRGSPIKSLFRTGRLRLH